MLRWSSIRSVARRLPHRCAYSTANTSLKNTETIEDLKDVDPKKTAQLDEPSSETHSKLVAAAFASLQSIKRKSKASALDLDAQLDATEEVDALLSLADQPVITKRHAFKVVSKLSAWVRENRCSLNDFSQDARFAKLCKVLGPSSASAADVASDLSIVLNVTADDQAAKLIDSVDLPQMVKIFSLLGLKKRRSVALLRSLSLNIAKSSELMNLKQAADVLYACAALNYVDEVLLEKIIGDVIINLKSNEKASVVKSIATSIGILRYRHTDLLENICSWFIENAKSCSSKEVPSILYTLANLNYLPNNLDEFMKISKTFLTVDGLHNEEWVDIVWSLIVLDQYDKRLLESVLNPEFVRKLNVKTGTGDIALKLKLLNINAYAKLKKKEYRGHLLDETSTIFQVPRSRTRNEKVFFDSVVETISNLVTLSDYVRTDVNTNMGFVIDVEVMLDAEKNFVNLSTPVQNVSKVAIMICTYHDMCRGCSNQPTGITALIHKLIEHNDYKLLCIPYTEFNPHEKLVTRIQYLSQKLKMLD